MTLSKYSCISQVQLAALHLFARDMSAAGSAAIFTPTCHVSIVGQNVDFEYDHWYKFQNGDVICMVKLL